MSDDFLRALEEETKPRPTSFLEELSKATAPAPAQQGPSFEDALRVATGEAPVSEAPVAPEPVVPGESAVDVARQVTAGVPFVGELATATGRAIDAARRAMGAEVAEPVTEPEGIGTRAVGRGVLNVLQGGAGAVATIAKGLEESPVSIPFLDEQTVFERALNTAAMAESMKGSFPSERMSFDDLMERGGPKDFAVFAAENLGEQVPVVASILASGGGGALVGQLVARGAVSQAAARQLVGRFALGGTVAGATAMETGFTALEQQEAIGDIDPGVALAAGGAKGSLEALVPYAFARRLGLSQAMTGRLGSALERAIQASGAPGFVLGSVAGEATTEALQEVIDVAARSFVDENFDALGPEAAARIREAAAVGALGGLFFGGGSALVGGRRAAPEFEGGSGPDLTLTDIQAGTAQPGQQLELFLGQDLGIEQPGVEPIQFARQRERQFELALEGGQGIAPETVDPRQMDLFDSSPLTSVEEPAQPGLFTELEAALPVDARAIIPRAGVTVDGDTVLEFSRPGVAFEQQAGQGARNTRSIAIDPTAGFLSVDQVSGDAFALPSARQLNYDNPNISFVGNEAQREEALLMAGEAAFELVNGTVENAQRQMREAFDLGFRVRPTERSGFLVRAGDVPGVLETDPAAPVTFGNFAPGTIQRETANQLPFSTVLFKAEDSLQAETLNLSALDPEQYTAVDLEGSAVDMIRLARAGEMDRAFEQATRSGITFTGERHEQVGALRTLAKAHRNERGRVFIDLFEQGRVKQSLIPLSNVYITGNLPPDAVITVDNVRQISDVLRYRKNNTQKVNSHFTDSTLAGGDLYDPAKHRPGTAVTVVGMQPMPPEVEQIRREYTRLLQAMGSKAKIIINTWQRGPYSNGEKGNVAGTYYTNGDVNGTHVIWLKLPVRDDTQLFNTAMHEFGHFLMATELRKAGSDVQEMLQNAFRRSLRQGARFGGRAAFLRQFSPERTRLGLETVEGAQARAGVAPDQFSTTETLEALRIDHWYDFDEWFAEQSVRWMVTSRKAYSVVDEFFKTVGLKLRKTFRAFMKMVGAEQPVRQMAAAPEVQSFLDSLIERRGVVPPLSQEMHEDAVRGERADAKASLDPIEEPAASKQAANYGPRSLTPELVKTLPAQERKRMLAQADRYTMFTKWGWTILQLADMNQHIAGLQRYVEYLNSWYNMKMRWIVRADTRVKEWNALGAEQADRLGRFLFDIGEMNYLKAGERSRWPTPEEVRDLVEKNKLGTDAFTVYTHIQQDFSDVLTQLELTLKKEARKAFTQNPEALQRELALIDGEMAALRSRPYFPFSRFGDWTIVVRSQKDGSVIYMEQFETRLQQKAALSKIKKQFPKDLIRLDKMPAEVEILRGLPPTALKSMASKLKLTDKQREWLDALVFEAAPSQSFRQRFQQRKGTPGFSYDAIRSYANYFFHGANHLARIEHEGDLRDSIQAVENETRLLAKVPDIDIAKRRQIIDFMRHHLGYLLTPENDWAALRSVAFQWYLGFSPSSALVNFTQIPMVAAPYLAAQYNDVKALNELRKATLDIHKIYTNKEGKVPPDEYAAIQRGIEQGFLDESQATELAGVSEGHVLQRTLPGSQSLRAIRMSAYWGAWMFQTAEKINRRIVFRAAYRLAKQNPDTAYLEDLGRQNELQLAEMLREGWTRPDAIAFLAGKDAVRKTQFEYARHARPRFMHGKKGTAFTFFMFTQNMLWFARHSPGRARYLAMLLATAGLMGLPGAEDLKDVLKLITGWLEKRGVGKKIDLEKDAREYIVNVLEMNPDLILHGISNNSFQMAPVADALGIPMPSIDMSGRLGMGKVVPGLGALASGGDFETVVGRAAIEAGGAAFNIPVNMMKALTDNHPDWFKRWERAMPTALRNLSRAARFIRDEQERTRTGSIVVEFDVHDPQQMAEIAAVAMGFAPKRLTTEWNRIIAQEEALQYWGTKRQILLQALDWSANVAKSREGRADAMKAIRIYNQEVPVGSLKITPENIVDSMKNRQRGRALKNQGLPTTRRDIPLAREINRLYPSGGPIEVEDLTADEAIVEEAPDARRR